LAFEEKKQKGTDNKGTVPAGRKKQKENDGSRKGGPRNDPGKTILMWLAISVAVVFALKSLGNHGALK